MCELGLALKGNRQLLKLGTCSPVKVGRRDVRHFYESGNQRRLVGSGAGFDEPGDCNFGYSGHCYCAEPGAGGIGPREPDVGREGSRAGRGRSEPGASQDGERRLAGPAQRGPPSSERQRLKAKRRDCQGKGGGTEHPGIILLSVWRQPRSNSCG